MLSDDETIEILNALPVSWRCFHCGKVFVDVESAREHFGDREKAEAVACAIETTHPLVIRLRQRIVDLRARNEIQATTIREYQAQDTQARAERAEGFDDAEALIAEWLEQRADIEALKVNAPQNVFRVRLLDARVNVLREAALAVRLGQCRR